MRIRQLRPVAGMSLSVNADHRHNPERWATAAAIGGLLDLGWPVTAMHPEMPLASGSRPDLVVIDDVKVLIFETKRRRPGKYQRRQVLRYVADAMSRWPERKVVAFLIWPGDEYAYPYTDADLHVEEVP